MGVASERHHCGTQTVDIEMSIEGNATLLGVSTYEVHVS